MKHIHKLPLFSLLALPCFSPYDKQKTASAADVPPVVSEKSSFPTRDDPEYLIQQEILENLDTIMAAQEEQLGITHFGYPKIEFQLSAKENSYALLVYAGIYENDTIYLNTPLLGNYHNVKETLDHELGHFYTDQLHKSWGLGSWPAFDYDDPEADSNVCLKIVDEGIAEYFERVLNNKSIDSFRDTQWPTTLFLFREESPVIFAGGYHLVKPIIDTHGKDGIAYLVSNPPTVEELLFLLEYQQQALEDLAGNVCQSIFDNPVCLSF